MISVYPSNEKAFADNGLKVLKPKRARVFKEDNGNYYLDIEDTIDNLEYYQSGMIIRVPTPWGKQPFRCTNPNITNKSVRHWYNSITSFILRCCYFHTYMR